MLVVHDVQQMAADGAGMALEKQIKCPRMLRLDMMDQFVIRQRAVVRWGDAIVEGIGSGLAQLWLHFLRHRNLSNSSYWR